MALRAPDLQPRVASPRSVGCREVDTDRLVFAGAWHGWGFHEDGARSGAAAAERLGLRLGRDRLEPARSTGGSTDGTITHTRRTPFAAQLHATAPTCGWSTSTPCPTTACSARFEARDHLGDPDAHASATNVEAFLAADGIDLTGGRILMAANARAFGYCFNPISVFWCHDAAGDLAATVVEVHNTYGDRHAYLVHPDERGRARVGEGDVRLALPRHRRPLRARRAGADRPAAHRGAARHTDDGAVFDAALRGRATDAGPLRAAPAAAARLAPDPCPRHLAVGATAARPTPTRPPPGRRPMTTHPDPSPPPGQSGPRSPPSRTASAPRISAAVARRLFAAGAARLRAIT